jgi:outer membrane protein TolC
MKRRAILIFSIIIALLGSSMIYADEGNSLDAEKVVIEMLESSGSLKSANTALDNAADGLVAAQKMPHNYLNPLASEYQVNYAQRQSDLLGNSIFFNSYNKYIEVLKANYAVEIQKKVVEQAADSYKNTQLRAKLEQVSKDQLQISEGQYNAEKLLLQIKERDLQALVASLNAVMGKSPDVQYSSFIDNNLTPMKEISSSEEYVSTALENRAEILNAKEQLEIKTLQKDNSFLPGYGLDTNPDYIQIIHEIDILNSQIDMSNVDIEIQILSLYDALKSTMAVLDSATDELKEAEKDLKAAELKYKLGTISKFDMNAEQISYLKIKYNFKQAQLDAWLMQNRMNMTSGLGLNLQ